MPSFTVQNIVDRAASQADMHDNFIEPSEWLAWFNFERKALALTLARGAIARDLTFTTIPAGSADVYNYAPETLAIVGVWEIRSDGRLRNLRIVSFIDNFFQQAGGPIKGIAKTVSIEESEAGGFNLHFTPADLQGTYLLATINSPAVATTLADTFTLPMGIEEVLVLRMARRALVKEESDTGAVDKLIKEVDDRIEEYLWGRAFAQSPSVRNVDNVQHGWGWGWDVDFAIPLPDLWVWL